MFNLFEHPNGVVGPAEGAGEAIWSDLWSEPDSSNVGSYIMDVDGVVSMPIPAPGALAVLVMAGLGTRRRRRNG